MDMIYGVIGITYTTHVREKSCKDGICKNHRKRYRAQRARTYKKEGSNKYFIFQNQKNKGKKKKILREIE